jgi:hypothetical protein
VDGQPRLLGKHAQKLESMNDDGTLSMRSGDDDDGVNSTDNATKKFPLTTITREEYAKILFRDCEMNGFPISESDDIMISDSEVERFSNDTPFCKSSKCIFVSNIEEVD